MLAEQDHADEAVRRYLERHLAASPDDPALRRALARHLVGWVLASTTALDAGRYEGDPEADLQRLDEAAALLAADDPAQAVIADQRAGIAAYLAANVR